MSRWAELLRQLTCPVVLAPMAGVSTPALVAAVSEVGGLGSYGAAYLAPEQIRQVGDEVRQRTDRPFALNLFAPPPSPLTPPSEAQVEAALAELRPLHTELGLASPRLPAQVQEDFEEQFRAVLDVRPAVLSFAFGRLRPEQLQQARALGLVLIGTATSLAEAQTLAADGVDAVVVQGGAAGGHRGGWEQDDMADTLTLTRAVRAALPLPLLAAGGLMTKADVEAALAAGATLAQCGTAFLLAEEAGTSAPYRAALVRAREMGTPTVITTAFSGRQARGLSNRVTVEVKQPLPYPHQNALTRPLRTAAAAQERGELLSLWAGEGVAQATNGSAAEILSSLIPSNLGEGTR